MKPSLKASLKVGHIIEPKGFPKGEVVSLEYCTLEPIADGHKKKRWPCWTVKTSPQKSPRKYLIVDWGKDGLFLWKETKLKVPPKNAQPWLERSGLEEMENITGEGPDSYIYSMLVFKLDSKANKLLGIERLRNNRVFRYEGFRIVM